VKHAAPDQTTPIAVAFTGLHVEWNSALCDSIGTGSLVNTRTLLHGLSDHSKASCITMSIQSMLGAHSLVAAGIGIGDVVTLCTLSSRVGNWLSAESGDQTLLNLLEEDETSILRRKGVIDIMRFQSRWGRRLRLLQNGVPKRIEGDTVEKLLKSSSRFTAMITCIVAALDAFTTDSTVRYIMKTFLQRLIPTSDINEDAIVSQLTTRINSWRSSGAVSPIAPISGYVS